jgi:3-oxoacyl-[acyl-carrier protein] reductase
MATDRVALVTGSRTGIGRHLAEHLLANGYRVVGCSRSECEWHADGYGHVIADVTAEADVRALMRRVASAGRLEVLVNNAGAASLNHALLTPASMLMKLLRTNTLGTFLVSREGAKLMGAAGFGRIINLSSIAVPLRLPGHAAYVAAKAGVERMSQVLAREFAPFGITVNVIGVTPIATDMIRGIPQQTMDALIASMPIRRLGTLQDVGNVVDFLIRPASAAVTGQIVNLGGVPNG